METCAQSHRFGLGRVGGGDTIGGGGSANREPGSYIYICLHLSLSIYIFFFTHIRAVRIWVWGGIGLCLAVSFLRLLQAFLAKAVFLGCDSCPCHSAGCVLGAHVVPPKCGAQFGLMGGAWGGGGLHSLEAPPGIVLGCVGLGCGLSLLGVSHNLVVITLDP